MWDIHLLGEQRVVGEGASADRQPSSRALELLAFLVVHAGAPQPRQYIAGLLWPDSADPQARTNLRRELHHLRHLLGEGRALVVDPNTLTWCDDDLVRVDLRTFRRHRRSALAAASDGDRESLVEHGSVALEAYRGELLPGSYEDWVARERDVIRSECVQLCDLTAAALADVGDVSRAIDVARKRVRLEPLEEHGYRTLIDLQLRSGDRAAAMSTFHRCASVLEEELGIGPGSETLTLVDAALGRDIEENREPVSDRPRAVAPLVGRNHELGRLAELWRDARANGSRLVAISGDPGVGKSRLAAELCALAREESAAIAVSRCFGQSGRLALAPVADWLRSYDLRVGLDGLEDHWRTEVGRLLPGLSGLPVAAEVDGSGTSGARAMVDRWRRLRFFEGLATAVLRVNKPLLLVLDDLQWCDEETLAWIGFLLRHARDAPLLIAVTYRSDAAGSTMTTERRVRELRSAGRLTEITLRPLDAAGTAELAAELRPGGTEPSDPATMHAVTGGYPLFVVEACRVGSAPPSASRSASPSGPASAPPSGPRVADLGVVLRRRLEEVGHDARQVAELASAVGRNFTLDLLSDASDLEPDRVVTAVDELWRRRIVREQGYGYDFSHDSLREAAYADITPAKRWLLHRRLAQALEARGVGRMNEVASQIANQYDRGGRPDAAERFYRQAGDAACAVFANTEALRYYQRCLDLVAGQPTGRHRDERELDILRAMSAPATAAHGYSSPLLERTQQRAVELAEWLDRPLDLLSCQIGLWAVRFVQGRTIVAHEIAEQALLLARSHPSLAGQAHMVFAGSATSLGRPAEAVEHFELARTMSRGEVSLPVGTRPEVHAMCWSAHAHWLLGHEDMARGRRDEAVDRAREVGHPYTLTVALAYAAVTDQMCADIDALMVAAAELTDMCERYGFAYYSEWATILTAWAEGGPASRIERAIEALRARSSYARMPYWLYLLADVHGRCGRDDAERAVLDAAVVAAHTHDDVWWLPEVMRRRAVRGEPTDLAAGLTQALALAESHSSRALARRCRDDLALVEGAPQT